MNDTVFIKPALDPGFVPAAVWNRQYQDRVDREGTPVDVSIALLRPDESCSVFNTRILSLRPENDADSLRHLERLLKFLFWQRGGHRVLVSGCDRLTDRLAAIYSSKGDRRFDAEFFGEKVYAHPLEITPCPPEDMPETNQQSMPMGHHLDGCRIGFDLGGSDRKCAAVIDGKVVFSEEVEWNPYFESDPSYHFNGVNDSLTRAAAHLPRVDAIGGSAAGIYVNNEVRAASLFRGVSPADFESRVRRLFFDLQERWDGVPFVVVNDGEVTALAGSMSLNDGAVLGIAMGTSQAAGYCDAGGHITPWLNELAFAPVDYREDAPLDEWSGDRGCGVQYFSQQAVARLMPAAGIDVDNAMPLPQRLEHVQALMAKGDPRAANIYSSIGTYLGYSIAHYAAFYTIRNVLLLGRVTSGQGGDKIIEDARKVLASCFPDLLDEIGIKTPDEQQKRHGQAVAAASLPSLEKANA